MRGEGPELGLSTSWNRARAGGLVPAMQEIGALGLGACEVDAPHAVADVRAAARFVAKTRMKVTSVRWPTDASVPFHDLAAEDPERRMAAERLAGLVLTSAALLKTRILVVPAFDVLDQGARWPEIERALDPSDLVTDVVAHDLEERARHVEPVVDAMCRAAHAVHAQAPGLTVAFAPGAAPGTVPGPVELDWILDDRPMAQVTAWHDTGVAAVREGHGIDAPGAWLEGARRRLSGSYVADASGVAIDLPPGAGTVDWAAVGDGLPRDIPRLLKVAPPFARLAVQEAIALIR